MIGIDGLQHLLDALKTLDLSAVQHETLALQADGLAAAVRDSLSHLPGSDHATPWLRTGELRDSIGVVASPDEAVVGSESPVAAFQENGTHMIPPRPFLAPAGAARAAEIAGRVGRAIVDATREALR